MTTENQDYIFLCYASEDFVQVNAVYNALKEWGYNPWMDKMDLLPGLDWDREIKKILKASNFIILFFSFSSVSKRGYVQKEFNLALEELKKIPKGEIFIIPVRVDDCQIPQEFCHLQYVNLFDKDGLNSILKVLKVKERKAAQIRLHQLAAKIIDLKARIPFLGLENISPGDHNRPILELEVLEETENEYKYLIEQYRITFKDNYDPLSILP